MAYFYSFSFNKFMQWCKFTIIPFGFCINNWIYFFTNTIS